MSKEKEMSFLDHLEELRWHLIRSIVSILLFAIIAFISKDIVFGVILLGPSKSDFWTYKVLCDLGKNIGVSSFCVNELPFIIQSRQMAGQFMMHISSSFVIGIICAFPYAFWEFWRFISPGLYPNERKAARGATFYVSILFFIGVFFGGSLIIETIFSLDGLGRLGFEAALTRDYPVMFGTLYFFGLLGLIIGLISDLVYVVVDPRIDFESRNT